MWSLLHAQATVNASSLLQQSNGTRNRTRFGNHLSMAFSNSSVSGVISNDVAFAGENRKAAYDYQKGVKFLVDTVPDLKTLPSEFALPLLQNPLAVPHAEIPVIDLSGLDGPPLRRASTIQDLNSACTEWGFFRIMNHGIEVRLLNEMLKVAEEFFELSFEEKMKFASPDVMSPVRYGTSLNTSVPHARHWRDYFRHYGHPFHKSFHLWPDKPPTYKVVAREYLEQIWKLAMRLAGAISESLGLEPDYIEKAFGEGFQVLAANYYPPCPEPEKTLGLAGHSDHGGLTILMQNHDCDGLQIKHNGEWTAVQHVPGTFLINVGDYLEILSNGKYKSVEHRAAVNAHRKRISVAVGNGPQLTAQCAPARQLLDKQSDVQYRPIEYQDYVRLQQSSAIRGKTPLQAIRINN